METNCCLVLVLMLHLSWSLSSFVALPSSHLCLPDQRDALLQFKNTISIDCWFDLRTGYPRAESWNKSIDCCSWQGVECDKLTGLVIGIDLSHSCLEGSLFPSANNSLFHLRHLRLLDLSFNNLDGSPLENAGSLFRIRGLRQLNLAHNNFNGTLSSELFTQLVSLTRLDLSYNAFSGLISYRISRLSNLVSLDLSTDEFSSHLRLDGQGFDMLARNLTKLRNLVLDSVDMSDVALTSFLNLASSLERLSLRDCRLHGEVPTQFFQLPTLKQVDLSWNENLTGYLPKINWSSGLELLHLSHCGFRGSIPPSFGNLTRIISLDLSGNWLQGQIPDAFGNLTKLTSLTCSSCNLCGQIPITMFNLTEITHLDLSHNRLESSLPTWLFALPSLLVLDLSYNKLASPVDRLQMPSSVQIVDLSSNSFDGPIPDSIFDLVNLNKLYLSSNNLSGVVYSNMLSKLTSLEVLNLSNNSFLDLSTSGNGVNYSFPRLGAVLFSSCSVRHFPNFFRTSKLKVLDLSNNIISGGISKWEAEGWKELGVLNLSYNSLTTLEQIPGRRLRILDLRSNLLQGSILSTCLNVQTPNPPSNLEMFLISENKLTGNIPSSICSWSSLTVLDLSENSLSGTIPECLGNFSYDLEVMALQMNNLYGKVPDSFVNNALRNLILNDNQLEGLVPPSLANSTSLEVLNLGNNKLTDRFPHWLASLPSLQVLILRSNRFHGSLTDSIASSDFSALRIIDFSGNEFSGILPTKLFRNLRAMSEVLKLIPSISLVYRFGSIRYNTEYYQTSVNVTTKRLELELTKTVDIFVSMDLSNNQFCGQIPEDVGQLISLQMLNFSHNNFTGPIPESIGNLVALESLDLSLNKLSGKIPSQMMKLTFLEVLNLSQNDLIGPIPHGNQFDTFDNDSYSGNLGLCGLPLSKQCNNHREVEPPAPSVVEHDDSRVPLFWQVVMMGYGSGVVLGLSVGYIVFTTRRPWWFVRMVEKDLQYKFTNCIRRNKPRRN